MRHDHGTFSLDMTQTIARRVVAFRFDYYNYRPIAQSGLNSETIAYARDCPRL